MMDNNEYFRIHDRAQGLRNRVEMLPVIIEDCKASIEFAPIAGKLRKLLKQYEVLCERAEAEAAKAG